MQCSFCGKDLGEAKECSCTAFQNFSASQTPVGAAPPPPMAPPPMAPPPMAPPPIAPPPMAPPPIAPPPMAPPPMAPPPIAPPPMTPPPMAPPPMAPPPMAPPPVGQRSTNQSVQSNINMEDMKRMTKNVGEKASSFWHHIKNLLGVNEEEDNGKDPFERGLAIVPDVSRACEEEIPIKQYRVANFRSRLQGLWAEGKVQITNKRVIFRAAGRSIIGRTTLQQEYIIDEIAGIEVAKGVRFSFFDFFATLILGVPLVAELMKTIVSGCINANDSFGVIIGIALGVGVLAPYVLLKKHLFLKALAAFASASAFVTMQYQYKSDIFVFAGGLIGIIALVVLFLFALRPSVSIGIMSKAGTGTPIQLQSPSHFRLERAKEMLPAEDTELAQLELGAIISDIQKFGNYGIEKWKE